MKKHIRAFVSLLCAAALALGCASCGGAAQSTGKSGSTAGVTHITVWTYYNGDQLESFNNLVDQFNETTGCEKGIRVESASQGSVSDLETNVMDAAQGKVGAAAMPNIFSAYADTAYALDQMGMLVDLSQYLTEDERARYVQGYLDEGDFDGDGSMKIFPVAKSTELMFLNETDWEKFAKGHRCRLRRPFHRGRAGGHCRCLLYGPTPRRRSRTTARLCSAATPWPTTCWWGPGSWATPCSRCRTER